MRCNQKFFGQGLFEKGTAEREFCEKLGALKPAMAQYEFALKDRVPQLPADQHGILQVKYNGMLSTVVWDEKRAGFVAWSTRGRCYYSLDETRKHPVTEYFNQHFIKARATVFVGETYVARTVSEKNYMTEFNKSMSIIKNPQSPRDVARIRLAVFDYAETTRNGEFHRPVPAYTDRFTKLKRDFQFPIGCDSNVVHLPDYFQTKESFHEAHADIQAFWDEFITDRGFEGLVMHTNDGKSYKIKFRDTLDAAIIAFRKAGRGRPVCNQCGAKFDSFWLRKLANDGIVEKAMWFDPDGRLINGKNDVWSKDLSSCPICSGPILNTAGPILGAKIALMTPEGSFMDIADGVQFSPLSPILDLVHPLYEADGYLWVKPEIVVEVSYQDLYLDRLRPIYRHEKNCYTKVGEKRAVSLRPYRPRLREDKTVTPRDLRLEQLNYFVNRIQRIRDTWLDAKQQKGLAEYIG